MTRHLLRFLFVLTAVTSTFSVLSQEVKLPSKETFHLFLLVGQSNMAGRGVVEAQDRTPHPRVLMLNREGKWAPAADPLHFDKAAAGVGLGKTFAELIAEAQPGITVGLIPCAVGGSPIDSWMPGALDVATNTHPWDDMMKRAEIALPAGTLKGILWHQGESDAKPEFAPSYEAKLHQLIARMRKVFEAPTVPFIAGQMGRFESAPWTPEKIRVDQVHQALPKNVPHTAFVSSEGLNHKGDNVHFDAASYRELGKRYAAAFHKFKSATASPSYQ
jgi:hypothetical protein